MLMKVWNRKKERQKRKRKPLALMKKQEGFLLGI
jgi:hypothetical protein